MEEVKTSEAAIVLDATDSESSDDEEDRLLQAEIEKLKIQVENDEVRIKAEKKEKKRLNRERLEQQKAELLRKSKAQQQLSVKSKLTVNKDTSGTTTTSLHRKADDLAAKQQQAAAQRRSGTGVGDNLTIGQVRSVPGAPAEVERLLAGLQALVPSLAKTPSLPAATGATFQPSGVMNAPAVHGGEEYDTDFVFH